MNHLYIVRGLPGSGKSTFARKLTEFVVEADYYFLNANGEYKFNPLKLTKAHEWCYKETVSLLELGDVAVANTFSQKWEMQRYLDLPNPKTVITCEGNYANIHNVPDTTIQRMKERWEMLV